MEPIVPSTKHWTESKEVRRARKALEKAKKAEEESSAKPVVEKILNKKTNNRHIVCLKWGDKYTYDYVNKLHNMCKRHAQEDFEFHCFTENATGIQKGIKIHNLPKIKKLQGWWFKPWFFSNELPFTGTLLFLDLDIVICNNIDRFFNYKPEKDFLIIRDFNRSIRSNWDRVNSSVFRLTVGSRAHKWDNFLSQKDDTIRRMRGDQDWMYRNTKPYWYWPDEWVRSYKWEMRDRRDLELKNGVRQFKTIGYPTVEKEQSIAVFHGKPNPADCKDPWVLENWQ